MSEQNDKPTDTPETEKELERSLRACHSYSCGPEFARKLERERDEAQTERDNLNRSLLLIAKERDALRAQFKQLKDCIQSASRPSEAQEKASRLLEEAHVESIKINTELSAEVADLRGQLAVCEEHARTTERDMQASIDALTNQLWRICKDGFNNDDTIGGEPADDYVLRQLAKLRADKSRLDWLEKMKCDVGYDVECCGWVTDFEGVARSDPREAIDAAIANQSKNGGGI